MRALALVFLTTAIAGSADARGRKPKKAPREAVAATHEAKEDKGAKPEAPSVTQNTIAQVTIHGPRILLGEVIPSAPNAAQSVDLGASPAPGQSRTITGTEIRQALAKANVTDDVTVALQTRAVRATKTITIAEFVLLAEPEVKRSLRPGVELKSIIPMREVVIPEEASFKSLTMPELPRQKGGFRAMATAEFSDTTGTLVRVLLPVQLDITEQASHADVTKGSRVSASYNGKGLQIETAGVTITDGNVGDTISLQITATKKVVRAKLITAESAEIL